jgi:hypothetical protein
MFSEEIGSRQGRLVASSSHLVWCLKRRVSDAVFKSLVTDSQAPSRSAA